MRGQISRENVTNLFSSRLTNATSASVRGRDGIVGSPGARKKEVQHNYVVPSASHRGEGVMRRQLFPRARSRMRGTGLVI